jgi:hypothetical protein
VRACFGFFFAISAHAAENFPSGYGCQDNLGFMQGLRVNMIGEWEK